MRGRRVGPQMIVSPMDRKQALAHISQLMLDYGISADDLKAQFVSVRDAKIAALQIDKAAIQASIDLLMAAEAVVKP